MKCATTTLHDQLARQPGLFLSTPKEPNFFGEDGQWQLGLEHYGRLFAAAPTDALCGESSTHYTKRREFPLACARMAATIPGVRLVYLMKHPVERLVSHYIHEWSQQVIDLPLERAVERHPELVEYSCYAEQLAPYLEAFGQDAVLPVFVPWMQRHPQQTLETVARHIGLTTPVLWQTEVERSNVSEQRLRLSPWMRWAVEHPVLQAARRQLVPRTWRDRIKDRLRMTKRPELSPALRLHLEERFDQDLSRLGDRLGWSLNCAGFNETVSQRPASWR